MFKLVPFAVAIVTAASKATLQVTIDPDTRMFIDARGRSVIFHGHNAVFKVDPYIPSDGDFDPQNSMNDEDIANLAKWGTNFIRLGVMWEGVEREEGVYDDKYLDRVKTLINKLGAAGIYTLIDAHQDVLARINCGEGMPDFYAKQIVAENDYCISKFADKILDPILKHFGLCKSITDYGFRLDDNGDPLIEDCQNAGDFGQFYTTKESFNLWQALYENKQGLQDKFNAFWDHTSAHFADNIYVVGYDPLNEPLVGNPFHNLGLELPEVADKVTLAPFYSNVYETYKKNDEYALMWFEPAPQPDSLPFFGGINFPVGFKTPPGGKIGSPYHVLNDHTYCCAFEKSACENGEPTAEGAETCLKWHESKIGQRQKDAKRLGIPLVITEFGACFSDGPCQQEIQQVADVADEHLVGWAYWQFKSYSDLTTSAGTNSEGVYNIDGTLQEYKIKALARSYVQSTQGTPTKMKFNSTNGDFTFSYDVDTKNMYPSEGYFSQEYYYPNGMNYTFKKADGSLLDESQFIAKYVAYMLNFTITDSLLDGENITLEVTAK